MKSERTIEQLIDVSKYLENQNQLKVAQLKSVLNYVENKTDCKSKLF
jgi:hypothetical protein